MNVFALRKRASGVVFATGHLDNLKAAKLSKRIRTELPIKKPTKPEMHSVRATQRLDGCTGQDGKTWAYVMGFKTHRPTKGTRLSTIALLDLLAVFHRLLAVSSNTFSHTPTSTRRWQLLTSFCHIYCSLRPRVTHSPNYKLSRTLATRKLLVESSPASTGTSRCV